MKHKKDKTYTLEEDQHAWLTSVANEYKLPDASKALRVLIDFAIDDGDKVAIFDSIRCPRC